MQHFPIFLSMADVRVVLAGGGAAALAKLRLLMKTAARIEVYAATPAPEIETWARQGRLHLSRRDLQPGDVTGAALVYAADEDDALDARTEAFARAEGVLLNVVDNLGASDFITPAIVDRDPVTVAIGTEGTAPVLARRIKASLEAELPVSTGLLARAAAAFRSRAETLPHGSARRAFWASWFAEAGPNAVARNADLDAALTELRDTHLAGQGAAARVTVTSVASADPDLLVMKARRALDEADVIVHDTSVAPAILELARREADFVAIHGQSTVPPLPQLLAQCAKGGRHVLYLGLAPLAPAQIAALNATGTEVTVIPAIQPLPMSEARKEQA
jgi:uroporphyrin-III C-methyltransferase/precorrin-2 dehydrogenase/sirohydrochlorin ferrochelatase